MTASLIPFPKPFRPHLVTPSEAAAALELHAITQQRMEQRIEVVCSVASRDWVSVPIRTQSEDVST